MKQILFAALASVAVLTSSCSKDNGGDEPVPVPEPVPVAVQSVSLNKPTTTILEGATETLSAVVAPAEAKNKAVSWSTSSADVATVSAAGLVTAVKEGKATITVTTTDGNKTATCAVTISKIVVPVTGVSLNKPTTTILEGATETLEAVVAPATATNQNVTWTSSDAAIATVSAAGLVTAVKEGKAFITVNTTDGNKTATCAVTVSPIAVTSVSVDPTAATIAVGTTKTLNATVLPADATNKAVTWTSSDAAIATVSEAGLVSAVKAGTATITVATQDGQKTATCTVTAVVAVVIGDLRWAVGNLVADGANGCKIGSPTDYGIYFHFGSLVGWAGGATGDGTGVTNASLGLVIKVQPTGYTGSTTWPADYYTGGTTDDKGYNYPATDSPLTGIGDPCRYYLGASWRTPTAAEYIRLVDYSGMDKGLPLKVNGYELYFPASGSRFYSHGEFGSVGSSGDYWSSSVRDAADGYYLAFYSDRVFSQAHFYRSFGHPVRCVAPAPAL